MTNEELERLTLAWNALCSSNDSIRKAVEVNIRNNLCMRASYNAILEKMPEYTDALYQELLYAREIMNDR